MSERELLRWQNDGKIIFRKKSINFDVEKKKKKTNFFADYINLSFLSCEASHNFHSFTFRVDSTVNSEDFG